MGLQRTRTEHLGWRDRRASACGSTRRLTFRGVLSPVAESPKRIERLSVRIDVEQFAANGARVYLIASIDSDRPGGGAGLGRVSGSRQSGS